MPSRRSPGKRRRSPLDRKTVLDAALTLADASGLEALSMRRLGQELGVEAMSLYNHVSGKDDLLDGLVDRVFDEVEAPAEEGDWKSALRACAISKRGALLRHPWATGLLESRTNPGPENIAHHEAVIGCLRRAGFEALDAVHAYSALDSYIYGFALQQSSLPFDNSEEHSELMAQMIEAMPRELYPNLYEVGSALLKAGYDHALEFEFGLDLILDGVDRMRR